MQEDIDVVENENVKEEAPVATVGLLFDLDTLACNGHELMFDVLKKAVDKKGTKLTKFYYAKSCMTRNISTLVPELIEDLKLKKAVEEDIIETVKSAYSEALLKDAKLTDGVVALVKAAQKEDFVVGVFSSLDEESAALLLEKVGLANLDITVCPYSPRTVNSFIGEHWRRLAVELSVQPESCLAVTSDNNSCKAALSSGMRVVVLPTEMSSFQDFGGANMIVDELSSSVIKASLKLLERD